MNQPDIAKLGAVPETLLIPLAARMIAPQKHPDLLFRDSEAERIGRDTGFDPARFADDTGSMRGSVVRAMWFDGIVRTFLSAHPNGLCVSIGSGLDDRPARLGLPKETPWVDVEFAEVLHLRETLITPRTGSVALAVDEANPRAWIDDLPWRAGQPVLLLAEGVMMYLDPGDGEALLRGIVNAARQHEAPLELVADFASPMMARHSRRNPSLGKTSASFTWALRKPEDLSAIAPGLSLVDEADIALRCGAMPAMMSRLHRLLTGRPIYFAAHFRMVG